MARLLVDERVQDAIDACLKATWSCIVFGGHCKGDTPRECLQMLVGWDRPALDQQRPARHDVSVGVAGDVAQIRAPDGALHVGQHLVCVAEHEVRHSRDRVQHAVETEMPISS
jgi:hypothetical protein